MDTYKQQFHKAGDPQDIALGKEIIRLGKVGCIVLAGGEGNRLGWKGPKGTFPLSLIKKKTLFQMLQERIEAASYYYKCPLKLAVMVSPLNYEVTKGAFSNAAVFFSQNLLPLLDQNKKPMKKKCPNGNGEVLKCFYDLGLFEKWKSEGIEYIQIIFIDNPLAEPFDPNQIGLHEKTGSEVTLKAVPRLHEKENVGVIGVDNGKLCIREYLENPPVDWKIANTSLFSFRMSFVEKVKHVPLPLHEVKKYIDGASVYKQEYFIFDLLSYSEKTEVILYPREEIFAPLKNPEDIESVQRALLHRDRKVFQAITGCPVGNEIIELHAQFHYPHEEMKKKWAGYSTFPKGYVSA